MIVAAGTLRGSTALVLNTTLPNIILHDSIFRPEKLLFTPDAGTNPQMIKKAIRLIDYEGVNMYRDNKRIFVLRESSSFTRLTKNLRKDYLRVLTGEEPQYSAFTDASDAEEELKAVIAIAQSMNCVFITNSQAAGGVPPSKLNPAELTCTCKGYRMRNICSHVVACTAVFINDVDCVDEYESYDCAYLKMLAEKLVTKKPAAHRPRRAVGAQRIQPHGDSASEDEEEEDDGSDEDLDEI